MKQGVPVAAAEGEAQGREKLSRPPQRLAEVKPLAQVKAAASVKQKRNTNTHTLTPSVTSSLFIAFCDIA